ncbi:MAG TPA: hypothetical protein VMM18_08325 [Gemmatimonadaceae bacterium]|nr:hypothetical protein [Gemmatimonadaceae bacterium]
MNGSSLAQPITMDLGTPARKSFLGTYRALAACTREFAQLTDEVVKRAGALHTAGLADKPVVRQMPGRCIVQLGPVALTLAWLRSTLDSVADGELLVIVWRGAVAPRGDHQPERTRETSTPRTAKVLWEDVLIAVAASSADWTWQAKRADGGSFSSTALADHCVEQLRAAHAAPALEHGS